MPMEPNHLGLALVDVPWLDGAIQVVVYEYWTAGVLIATENANLGWERRLVVHL